MRFFKYSEKKIPMFLFVEKIFAGWTPFPKTFQLCPSASHSQEGSGLPLHKGERSLSLIQEGLLLPILRREVTCLSTKGRGPCPSFRRDFCFPFSGGKWPASPHRGEVPVPTICFCLGECEEYLKQINKKKSGHR